LYGDTRRYIVVAKSIILYDKLSWSFLSSTKSVELIIRTLVIVW
jgi:hypothetical protein